MPESTREGSAVRPAALPVGPDRAGVAGAAPSRRPPAASSRLLPWVLGSILALAVFGLGVGAVYQQWRGVVSRRVAAKLDRFNTVPAFTFTERSGQTFRSADTLRGKIWVADFFFTTCPGPCLLMNHRFQEIQQEIRRRGSDVDLVSITIDPEHDTPAVLSRYAQRFEALPDRWFFLTGDKQSIYRLASNSFQLGVTDASSGEEKRVEGDFIHSTKLVLVDRHGVIRGYYDSADQEVVQKLLTDVGTLLREQPPGT